jgi:hypothetical protein
VTDHNNDDFDARESMDSFRADLDQAEASVKDIAPIVAAMYKALRQEGLSMIEATSLAAAWVWNAGRLHPTGKDDPQNRES